MSYPLQALIFDSLYDKHRGVIAFIRIFNGAISAHTMIHFLATGEKTNVIEVGVFKPHMVPVTELGAGEVGYIVTGLKNISGVKVGDTISTVHKATLALPGYQEVTPKVFASIFASSQDEYPKLKDAIEKLTLSDSSLYYEIENIPALGFGFRCGFLGLLHLEIVKERIEREFDVDIIITAPSVEYRVLTKSQSTHTPFEYVLSDINSYLHSPQFTQDIHDI